MFLYRQFFKILSFVNGLLLFTMYSHLVNRTTIIKAQNNQCPLIFSDQGGEFSTIYFMLSTSEDIGECVFLFYLIINISI